MKVQSHATCCQLRDRFILQKSCFFKTLLTDCMVILYKWTSPPSIVCFYKGNRDYSEYFGSEKQACTYTRTASSFLGVMGSLASSSGPCFRKRQEQFPVMLRARSSSSVDIARQAFLTNFESVLDLSAQWLNGTTVMDTPLPRSTCTKIENCNGWG